MMIRTREEKFDVVWDKLFLWCLILYAVTVIRVLPEYMGPFYVLVFHIAGVCCCFVSYFVIDRYVFAITQVHLRSSIVGVIGWPIVLMNILSVIVTMRWWRQNAICIFEAEIKNK